MNRGDNSLSKERFQRQDNAEEEENEISGNKAKERETVVNHAEQRETKTQQSVSLVSNSNPLMTERGAWSISRRVLTAGVIVGGLGLAAGGAWFFNRPSNEPVPLKPPVKSPEALVSTYQGHVHNPKKPLARVVFAFLAWMPQSTQIVSITASEFVEHHHRLSFGHVWDAFNGSDAFTYRFPDQLPEKPRAISEEYLFFVNLTPKEGMPRVVWIDLAGIIHVTDLTAGKDVFTCERGKIRFRSEIVSSSSLFSPDSRFVALRKEGDLWNKIQVQDIFTGQQTTIFPQGNTSELEESVPNGWNWSPNSQRLVSWYEGGLIRKHDLYVWQAETGQVQTHFMEHRNDEYIGESGGITHALWSPDGRLIASLGSHRREEWTLRIWNTDNGNEIVVIKRREGETSAMKSIQWSPDSQMLAIQVDDEQKDRVEVWHASSGQQIFTVEQQDGEGGIGIIQWSPNSQMLAVIADGTEEDKAREFFPHKNQGLACR